MFPAATLVLDVCVQRDFWVEGAWPLMIDEAAQNVARLLTLAAAFPVRRGGVVCRHDVPGDLTAAVGTPSHCGTEGTGEPPAGLPVRGGDTIYVASGCGESPDHAAHAEGFRRLAGGVRDAVVLGAGLEYGIARVVDALLRRRIRTHLVIDAVGAASDSEAQVLIAGWKRRGVDVVTVDVVARLLSSG